MGLEFDHDQGAVVVMKHLYRNGVWAIFSTLDKRVLQFKPGILIDREMCDEIMMRLDTAPVQRRDELLKWWIVQRLLSVSSRLVEQSAVLGHYPCKEIQARNDAFQASSNSQTASSTRMQSASLS